MHIDRMSEIVPNQSNNPTSERADPLSVLAIAAIVYPASKIVHEGIGHGLTCILVGGELLGFSSSWCNCDLQGVTNEGRHAVSAMGSIANLLAGAGYLITVARFPPRSGNAYYFVWLSAAVNLLTGAGYLMADPIFRFGDWSSVIRDVEAPVYWRIGLSLTGAVLSLGTFFILRHFIEPLLAGLGPERRRRARLLCWWPYAGAGGILMTTAALFNVLAPRYAFTSSLATLGGTFLMVWIPVAVSKLGDEAISPRHIRRQRSWLIWGSVMAILTLVILGPGISF
jgi:hypothetical protein